MSGMKLTSVAALKLVWPRGARRQSQSYPYHTMEAKFWIAAFSGPATCRTGPIGQLPGSDWSETQSSLVKHHACYLNDHKQKSINSSWLEIALWPQIWSLAPFILNVFNQIHHVFINEAIDTILCTNNFFARNHHKMHLGALFNISLREKGLWGWLNKGSQCLV